GAACRAAEPVPQVGVRLEHLEARRASAAPAERPARDAESRPADAVTAGAAPAPLAGGPRNDPRDARRPPHPSRQEHRMDTRRPPPEGADPIMAEYFETMR